MAKAPHQDGGAGRADGGLVRRPPGLSVRLQRAFVRDQREALELAAKVRMIALVPIIAWLALNPLPNSAEFAWQFASGAIYLPTSLLHLLLARADSQRFRLVYALFAIDVAIMGVFFGYPNPFSSAPISAAVTFNSSPFFWYFIFLLHAAFSANWRLVVWTGGWILIVRILQLAWVLTRPETVTEVDYAVETVDGWLVAIADPQFVFVSGRLGEFVGIASFTIVTAFLVWRSHRTLERQVLAERARAQIARYVSSAALDDIVAEGAGRFIAPREQRVAVLFVDVVGFTRMAEQLSPNETVTFLRRLHKRLAEAVFANGGAIDKFLGDGLMASFGVTAPPGASGETAAAGAIAAGRDMVAAVASWNEERTRRGEPPIAIGVGIDFGIATVGDVGDARRLEFTVVGDIVNVASRVEELTRSLDAPMLVTERAVTAAAATPAGADVTGTLTSLGPQHIRGHDSAVTVYALPN